MIQHDAMSRREGAPNPNPGRVAVFGRPERTDGWVGQDSQARQGKQNNASDPVTDR